MSTDGGGGAAAAAGGEKKKEGNTSADYYFDSYAHFGIHEEMLKDSVRTLTYRQAIEGNAHLFKDKIVLDVGCGTGILSMFAAKAGAKHVYALDMSTIITSARQIVKDNGLADKITLIKGKCEEIELPVKNVDIIISEWMGYALLYESMLPSVLHARDKWMNPDGIMMPDCVTIRLSGIEDAEYKQAKIDWWDNVYGFDMSCIKDIVVAEPLVDIVAPEQVVTNYTTIMTINTQTCTKEDLAFEVPFLLEMNRDDYLHALVIHFDTYFGSSHTDVSFSTGPEVTSTHWKQTVFYLNDVLTARKGEKIKGTIKCVPNEKNPRDLDFVITYEFNGELTSVKGTQEYKMR